jgi:RHS repeat-associated protein
LLPFQQGSNVRMTTTRNYDFLNRLQAIASNPGGTPSPASVSFNYQYNNANQRVRSTLVDSSYWVYQYDSLGQVISGKKYWRDGMPVAGQQFCYTFDNIGNRTQTQTGGDQNGGSLRSANYSANNLNQYSSRDVVSCVDIKGVSVATNTVTVNGMSVYRRSEYFRKEIPVSNSGSALWYSITVAATGQASVTGNVFLPQTPEQFSYDADGNLTSDGRWTYTWDAENRLVGMAVNTSAGPQYTLTFAYDPKGRRIQKMVATNGVTIYTDNFLYDGWNLIGEVGTSGSLVRGYLWGNDLSGSQQGAGGVGGLLEVSYCGAQTTNCFAAYDGNGNLCGLVNAADGTTVARYEYGPFGEVIRATGPMAKASPFRFSTKYQDDETDLLYYGYRFYNPSTGRWPIRDPIEEKGGINLYEFAGSDPIDRYDLLGLVEVTQSSDGWDISGDGWSAKVGPDGGSASHDITPINNQLVLYGLAGAYSVRGSQKVTIKHVLLSQAKCKPFSYTPVSIKPDFSIKWFPPPPTITGTINASFGEAQTYSISVSQQPYVIYTVFGGEGKSTTKARGWAKCGCFEAENEASIRAEFISNNAGLVFLAMPAFAYATEATVVKVGQLVFAY